MLLIRFDMGNGVLSIGNGGGPPKCGEKGSSMSEARHPSIHLNDSKSPALHKKWTAL